MKFSDCEFNTRFQRSHRIILPKELKVHMQLQPASPRFFPPEEILLELDSRFLLCCFFSFFLSFLKMNSLFSPARSK